MNDWVNLKLLAHFTKLKARTLQFIAVRERGVLVTRVHGKRTEYHLPDCVSNLMKREREKGVKTRPPAAKDRLLELQAEREELKLDQLRGNLVTIDEATENLEQWLEVSRARLIALPGKLAPVLVGIPTASIAQAKVEEGIRDALRATQRDAETFEAGRTSAQAARKVS